MAGNHQHRERCVTPLDLVEQFQPVHLRALQPHVEQDQRGTPFTQCGQRGVAVGGDTGLIAFVFQDAGDKIADILLVIDDEYVERHDQPCPC